MFDSINNDVDEVIRLLVSSVKTTKREFGTFGLRFSIQYKIFN